MKVASFIQRRGFFKVLILSGFISIISISLISGYIFFSFLQLKLLKWELTHSSEKIQSISVINNSEAYFQGSMNIEGKQAIENFFQHIIVVPNTLRINVYDANYKIIWSSDNDIIGKTYKDNEELKVAYTGVINFKQGAVAAQDKEEHEFLPEDVDQFVESYIPVWNEKHEYIVGVVELYKSPIALFELIKILQVMIGFASLLGGVILCGLLYWVVGKVDQRQGISGS